MQGADFLAQNNHQDVGILLMFLRSHNLPTAEFMIANGLTKTLGWPRKRLSAARRAMIELGYVEQVRRPSRRCGAALFHWRERERTLFLICSGCMVVIARLTT